MLMLFNFIEIALWHGCSAINLLYNLKTPFPMESRADSAEMIVYFFDVSLLYQHFYLYRHQQNSLSITMFYIARLR